MPKIAKLSGFNVTQQFAFSSSRLVYLFSGHQLVYNLKYYACEALNLSGSQVSDFWICWNNVRCCALLKIQ